MVCRPPRAAIKNSSRRPAIPKHKNNRRILRLFFLAFTQCWGEVWMGVGTLSYMPREGRVSCRKIGWLWQNWGFRGYPPNKKRGTDSSVPLISFGPSSGPCHPHHRQWYLRRYRRQCRHHQCLRRCHRLWYHRRSP